MLRSFLLFTFTAVLLSCSSSKITKVQSPEFLLLDGAELAQLKKRFRSGDTAVIKTVNAVITKAEAALKNPLYSVTFMKDSIAPSGDKRDYISMGPYWWPNPNTNDRKPYIRKDGQINPERDRLKDHDQQNKMIGDVLALGLGYYFTERGEFVAKADKLLHTWYVDESTKMNPHLNYGQGIPGITIGRGIGIIETRELPRIPDAIALMQHNSNLRSTTIAGVKKWFGDYLQWLTTSKIGLDERAAKNNHGTYYDVQVVALALFTGDKELAERTIKEVSMPRIDTQFTGKGGQPLELERTRSWNYSAMNLLGWVQLATLAEKAGVDLWHVEKNGKSLLNTMQYYIPYLLADKKWDYQEIKGFDNDDLFLAYRLAMKHYDVPFFDQVRLRYPGYDWNRLW